MFASRVLRNVAAGGNRLMQGGTGSNDTALLFGTGALCGLTALVYYGGWKAEGTSKASKEHAKELERQAAANTYVVPK
ncbi:hypothetical protein CPC08DRAFT_710228 [Agrocybe pediades]|nr:hypothetical protein CPC08DRAFT_710228 [Agrocybe pediades]